MPWTVLFLAAQILLKRSSLQRVFSHIILPQQGEHLAQRCAKILANLWNRKPPHALHIIYGVVVILTSAQWLQAPNWYWIAIDTQKLQATVKKQDSLELCTLHLHPLLSPPFLSSLQWGKHVGAFFFFPSTYIQTQVKYCAAPKHGLFRTDKNIWLS